ncbi:MAG: hypothetical protein ACE5JC_01780 [Candidatus Zixiibacteriota bacterium]
MIFSRRILWVLTIAVIAVMMVTTSGWCRKQASQSVNPALSKPARVDEVVCEVGTIANRISNSTVEKATGDNDYCIIMGDDSQELASMVWKTPAIYSNNAYLYFASLRVAWNGGLIGFTSDTSDSITVSAPGAISAYDTYFSITDESELVPDDYEQPGVKIHAHTYGWSESYRDDFIIYDFWIVNMSASDLDDLYVGWHADCDLSSAEGGSGAGGFWRDDKTGYYRDDATHEYISYMFDSDNSVVAGNDTGGNKIPKESTGYIGTRLLYCPPITGSTDSTVQQGHGWWDWNSDPDTPQSWYNRISDGVWLSEPPSPHDFRYLQKLGPFTIPAGDSIRIVYGFGVGEGVEGLRANLAWAAFLFDNDWLGPSAPPSPTAIVLPGDRLVELSWDTLAEVTPDPVSGLIDFEGYRLYKSLDGLLWSLQGDFDLIDSIGLNTGLVHGYTDYDVINNVTYYYAVTSYDKGDPQGGIESLESGKAPGYTAVPGQSIITPSEEVHAVPNPFVPYYYLKGSWYFEISNKSAAEERISFINLPGRCKLRIYSLTGDLIIEMENTDPSIKVLDWDIISMNRQKVVAGIYLFHVENIDDPEDYDAQGIKTVDDETIGKFVIIR